MRKTLLISQVLILTSLIVYGAVADAEHSTPCPQPQVHSSHCILVK